MFIPTNPHRDYLLELPFGKSCLDSYKKTKEAVFTFLHHLHVRRYLQKDPNAYISISSTKMSKECGKRPWESARDLLVKYEIIKVNHNYQIGSKCKSYRFNHEWSNDVTWEKVEKSTQPVKPQYSYPIDKPTDGWCIDKEKAKASITHRYIDNQDQLDVYHYIIDNINDYGYRTVGITGRIYTIYNGLPKQARRAIFKDGCATVELDVRNSQPLILASLCCDTEYKKAAESGKFYNDCAEDFQLDREDFKLKFLKWIGGAKDKQLDGYMMDRFPVMADFVIKEKSKNYKGLICNLQRIEAEIITKVPNSLSIHDGVVIKEEDEDSAREYIRNSFGKLGLTPKIKICR